MGKEKQGGRGEDRMKTERKENWDQVFRHKEVLCWTEPSVLGYIGILVTNTITCPGG